MAERIWAFFNSKKNNNIEQSYTHVDVHSKDAIWQLMSRIFLWENVCFTVACFLLTNVIFCVCLYAECRYFGIAFAIVLIILIVECLREIMPSAILGCFKSTPTRESQYPTEELVFCIKEVTRKAKRGCSKLQELRQNQPLLYLAVVSGFFMSVGVMARTMTTFTLTYIICMSAFIFPLLYYHILPRKLLVNFLSLTDESLGGINEEEFIIPDPEPEARRLLEFAANLHLHSNNFEADLNSMEGTDLSLPSIDSSIDVLDPDDDIPSPRDIDRSDSEDSSHSDIKFQLHHFNGNSEDLKKDALDSRLRIAAFGAEMMRVAAAAALDNNLARDLLHAAATSQLTSLKTNNSPSPPSSESSFEIIDNDEL